MSGNRTMTKGGGRGGVVRDRLRAALPPAIKARDTVAVAALRSALAAIDNAEAVTVDAAPSVAADPNVAGSMVGLGAGEADRRVLSEADIIRLIRIEAEERRSAARDYERAGRHDRAARLLAEAAVLAAHLPGTP